MTFIESKGDKVTAEILEKMRLLFQQFMKELNLPACKNFLQSYVDKVVVYRENVEVDNTRKRRRFNAVA